MRKTNLLLGNLAIATLYYLGARLGFLLSISEGNASSVWPPSGITLAAVLLGGYRIWPGILLGALAANILNLGSGHPLLIAVAVACGVATGGTLEAVTGAWLNQRWCGKGNLFDRGHNIIKFVAAAALSCTTSPTLGVLSLCLGGYVPWSAFGYSWFTWWIGDLTGVLVLTPLIVTWFHPILNFISRIFSCGWRGRFNGAKWAEFGLWLLLVGIITNIAFGFRYPIEYLMIPLLVWAALRFGRGGATLAIFLVAAIAIVGSVYGVSSFIRSTLYESLLLLQTFVGSVTVTTLILSAIINERESAKAELEKANQELEYRVEKRTAQLKEANGEITRLNQRLQAENLRMADELAVTRKLQQMILPKQSELESIDQLEIAGFMEPAAEVGGDYYDVLKQNGRIKIGIGDVTGHGLESGVLMIMVQTAVRTLQASNETDPVKFLQVINQIVYDNVQRMNSDKNLSLALLDYQGGMLRLSGQHEQTIVVRAGGLVERIDTIDLGFPIGLEEDIGDFVSSADVELQPGDIVVLYTDGITEAENTLGVQYGLERLCQVVSDNWEKPAGEIRQAVVDDLRRHIDKQKIYDDITLVVFKQK
jgi:sigma-B regulation protein RsbU (phosphoserine phosphatase)